MFDERTKKKMKRRRLQKEDEDESHFHITAFDVSKEDRSLVSSARYILNAEGI